MTILELKVIVHRLKLCRKLFVAYSVGRRINNVEDTSLEIASQEGGQKEKRMKK